MMTKIRVVLAYTVFTALLPGAFAETPPKPADPAVKADEKEPASMIFIDPATGRRRRPEPGEIDAIRKAGRGGATAGRTRRNPIILRGPGAAVGLVHEDDSMTQTVATRRPDGTLDIACVPAGKAKSAAPAERPASDEK